MSDSLELIEPVPPTDVFSEGTSRIMESRTAEESRAEFIALQGALLERIRTFRDHGLTFKGLRDLYEILGFSRDLSFSDYLSRYKRGGIAKRLVDLPAKATWQGGVELVEDDDPQKITEFEQQWIDFDKRFHVREVLERADRLACLSSFSAVLIGAPGDSATELPRGRGNTDALLYLTPFMGSGGRVKGQSNAIVQKVEQRPDNPRFGQPFMYRMRVTGNEGGVISIDVHWTRVIHITEDPLEDDTYGQPSLESVWNDLDNLEKVTGGGSEAFWMRAHQGIHMNVDKDTQLPTDTKQLEEYKKDLKQQAIDYRDGLIRAFTTRGVDIKTLGSDVADFSKAVDALMSLIAGTRGIPKRMLLGSELGELASTQDRENWKDITVGRQNNHASPRIVRPLADRLIDYNYLIKPKQYNPVWPKIDTLTTKEKMEGAKSWAETNDKAGAPIFTAKETRAYWYAFDPLSNEDIEDEIEVKKLVQDALTPPQLQETPVDGNLPTKPSLVKKPTVKGDKEEDEETPVKKRAALDYDSFNDSALDTDADEETISVTAAEKNQLHSAMTLHAPKFERVLMRSFNDAREVLRSELDRTFDDRAAERLANIAGNLIERVLTLSLVSVIEQALFAGGDAGLLRLSSRLATAEIYHAKSKEKWILDRTNEAAARYARSHAAELATQLSNTSRKRIKAALVKKFEQGGERLFKRAVLDAVGDRTRAGIIAYNEAMIAVSEGQRIAWLQAVDEGVVKAGSRRQWVTMSGEMGCPYCRRMSGRTASLRGFYAFGGGDGPPFHVGCQCFEQLVD